MPPKVKKSRENSEIEAITKLNSEMVNYPGVVLDLMYASRFNDLNINLVGGSENQTPLDILFNLNMFESDKKQYQSYVDKLANGVVWTASSEACGKCKKFSLKYYELQTRGRDEGMTLFFECSSCGNKFRRN